MTIENNSKYKKFAPTSNDTQAEQTMIIGSRK